MEFAFVVYLISVIGKLGFVLLIAILLSLLGLVAHCLYVTESHNKSFEDDFRMKFLVIPVILVSLFTITPSEKTMYLMAGAYASQTVVESDIGKDVVKILEGKIKEQLKEIQSSTKGN